MTTCHGLSWQNHAGKKIGLRTHQHEPSNYADTLITTISYRENMAQNIMTYPPL